jgi:hypothetical protein
MHLTGHRRPKLCFALVFAAAWLFAPGLAWAEAQELLPPIGDIGIRHAPDPPPPGGPRLYGATGPAPNWRIAQWNIPVGELSPFRPDPALGPGGVVATAPEAEVRITRANGETIVALRQDGAVLPCTTAAGKPRESDLLFSPAALNKPGPGFTPAAGEWPLAALRALIFTATVTITEGQAATRKNCAVNQGGALVALILTSKGDGHGHHRQTLFYQFRLDRFCRHNQGDALRFCLRPLRQPQYFFRANPFGVDDFLSLAGQKLMSGAEQRALRVDLLPRLNLVLRQAPPGMDRNPADWSITGFYLGQAIWGDITLATSWRQLHLRAVY